MAYTTVGDLRARLGIGDGADDAHLTAALAAAERSVDEACGMRFSADGAATARAFRVVDRWLLDLGPHTIATTTDLVVKVDDNDDGSFGTTLAAGRFQLEPIGGYTSSGLAGGYTALRAVLEGFPTSRWSRPTVEITARWGWPEVPAPIIDATLLLAAEIWKSKDTPFGVAGFDQFGAVRVRANPLIAERIAQFRRAGAVVGMG